MNSNNNLANLSEQQLLDHFRNLIRQDRRRTAALLAAIAEIDERKLWAKHACPSMFAFCVERFHMSESTAGKRIWAARTARRFPMIFEMVARGELHLSAIVQIAKHLTEKNHRIVLMRARHKTSREIDLLVAELAPKPDAPSRIRALPRSNASVLSSRGVGGRAAGCVVGTTGEGEVPGVVAIRGAAGGPGAAAGPGVAGESRPRRRVVPLAPRRYKIEITVDQETHDKLRMLEDLLSHELPSADPAVIVSRAIELLLDETLRKKAALSDRARPGHRLGDRRSRAIPAAVRREVWKRDGGRCTFVDEKGRRCRSTRSIEYHHQKPYAEGGRHETANIALRCRAHNQYQADLDFGRDFMLEKRGGNGTFRAECSIWRRREGRCRNGAEGVNSTPPYNLDGW